MGSAQDDRIGLLFCADGVPIYPGCSVMPAEYSVLSLPPQLRHRPEFMLLSMLFPDHLKPAAQKKYFDFVVGIEINPLATVGVRHETGFTKVVIFTTTFDLPARDKFFQLRGKHYIPSCTLRCIPTCTPYLHPCTPCCTLPCTPLHSPFYMYY